MKTLKEAIQGLNQTYNDIGIIEKWCKTERGKSMFTLFQHGVSIHTLIPMFQCPKIRTKDAFQVHNIYKAAFKKAGYRPEGRFKAIPGYSKTIVDKQSTGALKLPKNASKREIMAMNRLFKTDYDGNLIQASDKDGRKFWNSVTNKPIYKRARQYKKGLQLAEKCHMYELNKMAKWDRRHPVPSLKALRENLFPEMEMAAYQTSRNLFLENTRNELAMRYCHSVYASPLLKMYSVHHRKGYQDKMIAYEVEIDPYVYGYPFCGNTPVHESLLSVAKRPADPSIVAFKVYDRTGRTIDEVAVAA